MKNLKEALADLEDIIETKLSDYSIPNFKGSMIRIGNCAIRYSKTKGYIVFDVQTNKSIITTFSKVAAVAVAKSVPKKINVSIISRYDTIIEKNYNDIQFYSNVIQSTNDKERRKALEIRLDDSRNKIDSAKSVLDDIIMCDLR